MPRKYEKVQKLLPIIKARLAEGKTQREVAEEFGLKDKYVVQQLLTRKREKERKDYTVTSFLLTPTVPGKRAPMKTATVCCENSIPKAAIFPASLPLL